MQIAGKYMDQGYLPNMGMEAQQNPGPMPGVIGGPSFPIPGGQSPYRQPYLPGEEIPEEDEPFVPLPLAQGQYPSTPVKYYPGMGYGPYGPGGGGLPPTPMRQA